MKRKTYKINKMVMVPGRYNVHVSPSGACVQMDIYIVTGTIYVQRMNNQCQCMWTFSWPFSPPVHCVANQTTLWFSTLQNPGGLFCFSFCFFLPPPPPPQMFCSKCPQKSLDEVSNDHHFHN